MSDEVAAKTQAAIDKFWADQQSGTNETESLLKDHLRTLYKQA